MREVDLLALLNALADGDCHSGERLAEYFGISRAALGKRVRQLRDLGVEVAARAGAGYQLPLPWQPLSATRIRQLLPAHGGISVKVLTLTDSTNTQLLAAEAAGDPQVLIAEHQSAGRGRRGRAWASPFGANLYLSLAWSFDTWPARLTTLPLAVAVALCRALGTLGLDRVRIKWPNDLQVDGRKIAGILIEPRGETGGSCRVVIGVGLNVAMRAAQAGEITQPWMSLQDALGAETPPDRNVVAATVIAELLSALGHFRQHGFAPFVHEWKLRDALRDRSVQIDGEPAMQGIARGVDEDGGLLLETAEGRRAIHAGEVSVRAA